MIPTFAAFLKEIFKISCVTINILISTQEVNELYQDAHNCPPVDLDMEGGSLSASEPKKIPGWTVTFDKNQKVREADFNVHVLTAL